MCGIAGGVFWQGTIARPTAESEVRVMVHALGHRGPDGAGLYVSPRADRDSNTAPYAVLGHTRLAIIDVSDAGSQPMGGRHESTCITYNGEAYNFQAVRSQLAERGISFRSKTDTEVILRGYDVWGVDVLTRLRGMFAFGLWDDQLQRLLV